MLMMELKINGEHISCWLILRKLYEYTDVNR